MMAHDRDIREASMRGSDAYGCDNTHKTKLIRPQYTMWYVEVGTNHCINLHVPEWRKMWGKINILFFFFSWERTQGFSYLCQTPSNKIHITSHVCTCLKIYDSSSFYLCIQVFSNWYESFYFRWWCGFCWYWAIQIVKLRYLGYIIWAIYFSRYIIDISWFYNQTWWLAPVNW